MHGPWTFYCNLGFSGVPIKLSSLKFTKKCRTTGHSAAAAIFHRLLIIVVCQSLSVHPRPPASTMGPVFGTSTGPVVPVTPPGPRSFGGRDVGTVILVIVLFLFNPLLAFFVVPYCSLQAPVGLLPFVFRGRLPVDVLTGAS